MSHNNQLKMADILTDNIKEKKIAKGVVLQHQGDTKMQAYFVKKGLLRSYYIDNKGKEHTFMFAPENWIISDLSILSSKKEAQLIIEAIEDTDLYELPKILFEQMHQLPEGELIRQIHRFINRIYVLQTRVIMLLSASAEDRYINFMETYPDIIQRVPQKMIASYLGLTPEALSRAKKTIKDRHSIGRF